MADCGIVQKAEIVIVRSHCGRVRRKPERKSKETRRRVFL